jgi:hypothetical protein
MNEVIGTFRGTVLRQSKGNFGGARSVFAKFKGIKNELVYPYNGGQIKNAPKGNGFKFFAGDLMEYRTNEKYALPEVYLLKTYKVVSASGAVVNIEKDGFKHIPFVGDKLGVAPEELGGEMTAATITKVVSTKVGEQEVWACTFDSELTAVKNDVLVEADEDGKMLVKQINAFADCDGDLPYSAEEGDDEFEKAKYFYTPAVGGVHILIHKMSPVPACVLKVNASRFNGLFALPSLG